MIKDDFENFSFEAVMELLKNTNITEKQCEKLIKNQSTFLTEAIFEESRVPEENLLKIGKLLNKGMGTQELIFVVFNHLNLPLETLTNFAYSKDEGKRKLAAQHNSLPIEVAEILLEDESWDVRHEVLFNDAVPQSLRNLYIDEIY